MPVLSATPFTRPTARLYKGRTWAPEGQLLLREALMCFGNGRFGDGWTGEELWARHAVFGPPQPPREPESNEPMQVKRGGRSFQIDRPVRYVVDEQLTLIPYDEAIKRYENEKDELYDMWRQETAAFQRYIEACSQIRQVLHAGHVPAFILTNHGHTQPVPKYIWSGNDAGKVFKSGRTSFAAGDTYSSITVEGIVLIPQDKLEAFLHPAPEDDVQSTPREAGGQERDAASPELEPTAPSTTRSVGGRPAKWDWEACWVQICRRIYLDGLPATQAELVKELQAWFVEQYGDGPSDSQVKERVSKVFQALREAENS